MKKLIVCLHAAQANINIIEDVVRNTEIKLEHVVDAQLLKLIRENKNIDEQHAYVLNMMNHLFAKQPDIIFITCTNYIALLDQLKLHTSIPIIKIDEVLFKQLYHIDKPIKLLFTNKNTINGTMSRLNSFITSPKDIEIVYIDDVFEWYLEGDIQKHDQAIFKRIAELDLEENVIVVAQLSMSNSASLYSGYSSNMVISPATALKAYLSNNFIGIYTASQH